MSTTGYATRVRGPIETNTAENRDPIMTRAAKGGKPSLQAPPPAHRRALGEITNTANNLNLTATNSLGFHAKKPHTTASTNCEPAAGVLSMAAATKLRRGNLTKPAGSNSAASRRAKAAALAAANAVAKDAAMEAVPDTDRSGCTSVTGASPMSTNLQQGVIDASHLGRKMIAKSRRGPKSVTPSLTLPNNPVTLGISPVLLPELQFDLPSMHSGLPYGVIDIDAEDAGNHLSVCEFADEIHQNLVHREEQFMADADYMLDQPDITVKMRAILIDWLVDVHLKFKLQPETLHLTINIIDRFLASTRVMRRKLQLVGVTAMLIASKYEEIYAPEVADFVYISDKAYTKEEILQMEALMLNVLKFNVTVPSSLTFLQRNLKALRACFGSDFRMKRVGHLAHYVIELALQDSGMLRFRPSERAAAACLLAAKIIYSGIEWNETLQYYSGNWSCTQLEECEEEMLLLVKGEQDLKKTNKLTAIKRKFGSSKYSEISTVACSIDIDQERSSMDICNME